MKKEIFLTSLFLCLAFLLAQATNSQAQTYVLVGNETQLTTDAADQFDPKISGDIVVYTDDRN